eukprot:COSAG01_NODE_26111_length_723_cov_0.969551_1_plen_43_part_10
MTQGGRYQLCGISTTSRNLIENQLRVANFGLPIFCAADTAVRR